MERKLKILLAEDDVNFGSILKSYLELNDYEVILRTNGKLAWAEFFKDYFDICILDVMMPEMDGYALAREIRASGKSIPIIFLTAKTLKADMIQGFEIGADDYITKPFDSEILLLKIKAITRRSGEQSITQKVLPEETPIGKYTFNYKQRYLSFSGIKRTVTPKEAELLRMLCLAGDEILQKKEALMKIWGDDSYFAARSMDVFMARIRKYLKDDPNVEILSVHGNGYRLIIKA
jgi:DNA-binding response OmpR family regulator